MLGGVENVVQALADFWLDDICHACGRPGEAFAALPRPRDAAAAALTQPLRIGGARLGVDTRPLCRACCHDLLPIHEPVAVGHLSVWPAFETDARILAVVHALKFSRRERLAAWLARAMAEGLPARALDPDDAPLLVPVPMDRASLLRRGFNQAERLATALAVSCGGTVERDAIVKVRRTAAQSMLGSDERVRNVAGAMEPCTSDAVRGRRVILVDDLVTTGATAAECVLALTRAGAREVRVVCVGYRP